MPEDQKSLIGLANSSGFLFQYRVEQEVARTRQEHGYEVVASEYHWQSKSSGMDGYIDIILEKDILRMVIECKRVRDTNWLFLIDKNTRSSSRARLFWTQKRAGQHVRYGWDTLNVQPIHPESSICVMRGQNERDKPILERLLSILTTSIESLADDELGFKQQYQKETRLYVPIIVTNGDLAVCHFDSDLVDLDRGEMETDKGTIEFVPFVRFRKTLSTSIGYTQTPSRLIEAGRMKERTVFIVKASELPRFLKEWNGFPAEQFSVMPWALE